MGDAPRIIVEKDPEALLLAVRAELERGLVPGERICLPTGRTPEPLYSRIVADPDARGLWCHLQFQQLDEYIDPPDGVETFAATLARQLFDPLGIPQGARGAIISPEHPGEGARLDAIHRSAPLAACLLGLGGNGHIAFNEPGDTTPGYHRVRLAEETTFDIFGAAREEKALTIGVDQILSARRVLLWVPQPGKQDLLDRVLEGTIDPALPATALRRHPDLTVFRTPPAESR